jgi:hypothetical protein
MKSFGRKLWRGSLSAGIVTLGLLSIIGTGGGGGNGNGDEPGTLQFSPATYSGNEDAGEITVTVTRTGGSDGTVTVDVSDTNSGTATSGADYTAISTTTLTWADGDSNDKTFVVSVIADGAVEADETVGLALDNVTGGASLGSASATVTILNDDVAGPGTLQFSASSYTVAEDGSGNATITVTRLGGDTGVVGVNFDTSDGTATVADGDYTAVSIPLTWGDGSSGTINIQVPITNDTDVEVPETVNLALSSPSGGATLGTPSTATLTITSEDKFGTIRFNTTSYNVGETDGTVDNVITLERVDGSSGIVSVDVSDAGGGSATSGTDYTAIPTTQVSWGDGDTADKNVTIILIDDSDSEGTETVNLSLGNVAGGASIGTPSTATVNVADDEAPPSPGELQFDTASYGVAEGGLTATITVNRVNGTQGAVEVNYATSNGTATASSDYTAASGTLSWSDAEGGAKTFTVPIIDDSDVEGDETVNLSLSSPTGGATLGTPSTATLTIDDDDTNLTMNIGDGTYWVAFQDGIGGTWTEWAPTSGNTYDFPVTDAGGRYGVAFHRQETDGTNTVEKTYVLHATLAELTSLNTFHNMPYEVTGTLSGYTGSNDSASVAMHTKEDYGEPLIFPYPYSLERVSAGTRDLLASEWDSATGAPGNFFIERNINITGDLAGQDVDFSTDGTPVTFDEHDFAGGAADQWLEVYYSTGNGTVIDLLSENYDGTNALKYPYLTNPSLKQAGDAYSFQVYKEFAASTSARYRIRNFSATSDPGNRSIGLGNIATLSIGGINSTQTWGLSYTPDPTSFSGSPVFRAFQISLDQTVTGIDGGAHWAIEISAGWLGTSTSYSHPLFSGVSGYNAGWDMSSGTNTIATVSAVTTNNGTGLSLITRKTMGASSINLDSNIIEKKLAQNDSLKADIAMDFWSGTW